MPAKDNDPTTPRPPAKKIAKPAARKTTAKAPIEAKTKDVSAATDDVAAAKPARRRRAAVADTVAPATAKASATPKRRSSVRRPKAVTAATEVVSDAAEVASVIADSIERQIDAGISFEEEVRLRAYLLYAERGFHGGSPESDWFRAEREVAHGRQS